MVELLAQFHLLSASIRSAMAGLTRSQTARLPGRKILLTADNVIGPVPHNEIRSRNKKREFFISTLLRAARYCASGPGRLYPSGTLMIVAPV